MGLKPKRKPDRCCYVLQVWSPAAASWMGREHFKTSASAIRGAGKILKSEPGRVRVVCMEQWVIFEQGVAPAEGKAEK
ncbi:MAG TPA: hypothetical protein VGK96_28575 [Candidatus Sulfotelmatobacter sp.]|jgi:hypothetical protein